MYAGIANEWVGVSVFVVGGLRSASCHRPTGRVGRIVNA
jgi:hypothetical protein